MTSVNDILNRARNEIGTKENPLNSNRVKYCDWYYGRKGASAPWCAIFVSWVFYHEEMPLPFQSSKGFAAVQVGAAAFKARKQWHTSNPKPGDIVFFTWSHVGIVESVNRDGSIVSIEGNSSHRVQRVRHSRSKVRGYGRPNLNDNSGDDDMPLSKEDKAWIKSAINAEVGLAYKLLARAEGAEGKRLETHVPQSIMGTFVKVDNVYKQLMEQLTNQSATIAALESDLRELKQHLSELA